MMMRDPDVFGEEFVLCWLAAARSLQEHGDGESLNWIKDDLHAPFLEHLSFRLGNQLFFIRLEDVDQRLQIPGDPIGLNYIAESCNGVACLMPMRLREGEWTPQAPGWGLLDAKSGRSFDPVMLVSDEEIEMTDWELHDFAVQVTRARVTEKLKRPIQYYNGDPGIAPSVIFEGESGPEWIVVGAARHPQRVADKPEQIDEIIAHCKNIGDVGYFASVPVISANDGIFDPARASVPLWRGHGLRYGFAGLELLWKKRDHPLAMMRRMLLKRP
ncbi:hypothetical protein [Magnetofaba australis]|uniref:Uncharacterized protein n=1 Tax=Magnetofaba australis IT-1 TaxID=1434232 RepID=A0A1Y2K8J0_9PROT|nr:hypothetical protein [Magnetofaba australis]OSM07070.1 hypothetical protein MAIT1_00014 [Magnetofaba australis IT-1]